MAKKILVSYADENLAYSLKRIGRQANQLNVFDEVLLYTPDKLPDFIRNSPLMKYKRGGGYWAWKPAIIWDCLQKHEEGDMICYVDAGCSLKKTKEWEQYFELLNRYDTLCFKYKDCMPSWAQFGQTSTKIKYWSKQMTISYFQDFLKEPEYAEFLNMIWGGCLFLKNRNNELLREWLRIVLEMPELIVDPSHEEFNADFANGGFHTHDQAVLTPLCSYFNQSVCVLDEKAETTTQSAITGSRIRAKSFSHYQMLMLKRKARAWFGDLIIDTLKSKLQK